MSPKSGGGSGGFGLALTRYSTRLPSADTQIIQRYATVLLAGSQEGSKHAVEEDKGLFFFYYYFIIRVTVRVSSQLSKFFQSF